MSAQLAPLPELPPARTHDLGDVLTATEWAKLLDLTPKAFRLRRVPERGRKMVRGVLAKLYVFADLPPDYQATLVARREKHAAPNYAALLAMRGVERRKWNPPKPWESYPAGAQERALKRMVVMRAYYAARDQGRTESDCNTIARQEWGKLFLDESGHPEYPSFKTIHRLKSVVDDRGGEFAPREAYCDGKSCRHDKATLESRLAEIHGAEEIALLAAEIKDRATRPGIEHMSAVHHSLRLDWLMGREVPGIGFRRGNEDFPFTAGQLRRFMPSTGARRLGSHGEARYQRECAPWVHSTVASLRPLELVVLDDTRIDIICHDDLNPSRLVELKAYILMDVATRRILGFTIKDGPIGKEDVSALLARFLRGCGIPQNYPMTLLFERGAVACSDAAETLLRSIWPGRIEVVRTSMDGGRSQAAAFWEAGSGHWMGKAWIESFMRTLAISLEHLPGQRGGDYRRQPTMLGFQGREHSTGRLLYAKGKGKGASTQMHDGALTGLADLALQWVETGGVGDGRPRLKASPLKPRTWIVQQITECIALYNAETDHRREGFARIETLDDAGALTWRMESSNERWAALSDAWPAERVSPADAASLLKWRGKTVKVDARSGVTFDLAPYKGLRFYRPDSHACFLAGQLATMERRMVALYDEEAIRTWRPESDWPLEIHLLADTAPDWKPGMPGRYIETLPLYSHADRADATAMAAAKADKQAQIRRTQLELVQAAGPGIARSLRDLEHDEAQLRGVIVPMDLSRAQMAPSELGQDIRADHSGPRRVEAVAGAAAELAEFQAAHAATAALGEESDAPEIF